MKRVILASMDGVPAHLMARVAAAFAAGLQPSVWEVRDLMVVHVDRGIGCAAGGRAWELFDPERRDSDALEVYTRIAVKRTALLQMTHDGVSCGFGYPHQATVRHKDYANDAGAALRGAIVTAAVKLYKHEKA